MKGVSGGQDGAAGDDVARELFDRVTHDQVFVARVAERIRGEVQSYGLLTLDQVLGVGADWSRFGTGSEEFEDHFFRSGQTRAEQGVPASEMLLAYRIFHQEMRRRARELSGESAEERDALLAFLELSATYVDAATLATSKGHHAAELRMTRRAYHDRATVVRRVIFGGSSGADLRNHLEALSVDLSRPFHAVRARPSALTDIDALERLLISGGDAAHRSGLLALIDGDLCGFVTALPAAEVPVLVGHSAPVPLLELPKAFALASRALTTALAMAAAPGFYDLGAVGLNAAVLGDHEVGDVLVARFIEPLEQEGQAGRTVIATVKRYLENDSRLDQTAKDLWVHVNTVRYRLGRFQEATGTSLRSTEDVVAIWWALARRRLVDGEAYDDLASPPPDGEG